MASFAEQLSTLIDQAIDARLSQMFGMLPGKIVSYNANNQTADVQPEPNTLDEDGAEIAHPVLPGVLVRWPRGHGGCAITMPLTAGDRVMLVAASAGLDRWAKDGTTSRDEDRRGDLSDMVALPGMYPASEALGPGATDATAMVLSEPTGGHIHLGKGGGPGVARQGDATGSGSLAIGVATVVGPPNVTTVTFTWTPEGGGAPTIQTVVLTGALTSAGAGVPFALAGKITSSSATVLAKD